MGIRQHIKHDVYFVLFQLHPLIPIECLPFASIPIPLPHPLLPISLYSRALLGGLLNLDQMHILVSGKRIQNPKDYGTSGKLLNLSETQIFFCFNQQNEFDYTNENSHTVRYPIHASCLLLLLWVFFISEEELSSNLSFPTII